MSSLSKENVKRLLQNARNNPSQENFQTLQKAVVQYVDMQLTEADSTANNKLQALTKELDIMRGSKASVNSSLAHTKKELEMIKAAKAETDAALTKMQQELDSIQQALAACRSTEVALSKRAKVINDSMNVVKTMMRHNDTAMISPSSR